MKSRYSERFLKRKINECVSKAFDEEDADEKLVYINDAIAYLEIYEDQTKEGV